jgi:hypothetical protein
MPVENGNTEQKRRGLETVSTIVLSLATVLSSWCAFQASQWNGEQYFRIDDENIADNKRLQLEIAGVQRRAGESNYFLYYLDALGNGDKKKTDFLESGFPSHLKIALDKWKTMDPLHNPDAPRSPFLLPEYLVPETEDAKKFATEAAGFKQLANQADRNSDNYLFLSIIISMALFFTGLSGITSSHRYKRMLILVPILIISVVLIVLLRLPVII